MRAFVFSGGGNRGALQVGALEALLQRGVFPDMLVGVSAGAVNAALFASNPTLAGIQAMKAFWLDDLSRSAPSLQRGQAIMRLALGRNSLFNEATRLRFVESWPLSRRHMSEFTRPQLYITSVCLSDGELRVFGDGQDDTVGDAVMASTALPPFFSPWQIDGGAYVDGGARSNLPVRVAADHGADEIYALNLVRPFGDTATPLAGVFSIGARALGSLLDYTAELELEIVRQDPRLQLHLLNLQVSHAPPVWDLSRTGEMIETGHQIADQYIE